MLKYRGSQLIRAGFIGVVLIMLVIAVGLQPERLMSWATAVRYQALFAEAGGLAVGNDVTVSGIKVGTVSSIELDNGEALVGFTIDGKYALGSDTTAHIRTGTLLGERVLALDSAGSGTLDAQQVIPDVADVVAVFADGRGQRAHRQHRWHRHRFAEPVAGHAVADARPGRSATGADVRRVVAAVAVAQQPQRHSGRAVARPRATSPGIFSERSKQVNTLILNANDLLAVLDERRYAITSLLANISAVSSQLTGVVADNEQELAPALEQLNTVTAMLEKNRDNLAKMLPGAAKY